MHDFLPSSARARLADANMHLALADSLSHLADAVAQTDPELSIDLQFQANTIRAGGRVPPLTFALYYRLTLALMKDDRAGAREFVAQMAANGPRRHNRLLLVTGTQTAMPLVHQIATEGDPLLNFAPVSDVIATEFAGLLDQGFALMQTHLPELKAEIDAIVHEILLGHAQEGAMIEFDGASHYQYWGLLMLNPKHHKTPLAVVEVLAHECAHSLLFGLTIEEPLVLNPDSETFVSPLRPDPRPMDGIYHATFVSARMAYAMERMALAADLSEADRQAAKSAAATDRANFASGLSVVRAHGRLSATGAAIMASAEAWISG